MQLMILLSALLASLTGMVAGERPVARAQVELSAAATAAQPAATASHAVSGVIASQAPARVRASYGAAVTPAMKTLPVGMFLAFKQSWLH